jgi:dynein heavy chain, axonemal
LLGAPTKQSEKNPLPWLHDGAWAARRLFERHKIIFLAQLTFNLMKQDTIGDGWNEAHFQFLLGAPTKQSEKNPLPWLHDGAWAAVSALTDMEEFSKLTGDMIDASPRFREWFNTVSPENEKLPLDWASLDRLPFQKMLVIRCLRPDRMTSALANFVRRTLPNSSSFVDCDSTMSTIDILSQCIADPTARIPIYFILSPGANIVADLDVIAVRYGLQKGVSYHNISMGQGQDLMAMSCLETTHRNGHWVLLNNMHLMVWNSRKNWMNIRQREAMKNFASS